MHQTRSRMYITPLLALSTLGPSMAQPADPVDHPSGDAIELSHAAPDPDADRLRITFTPYAWATSFSGTSGVNGVRVDISDSFIDILDEADSVFGLFGDFEITAGKLLFQLNGAHVYGEFSERRSVASGVVAGAEASVRVDTDLKTNASWIETSVGYRLVDRPLNEMGERPARLKFDVLAGGRFTSLKLEAGATAEETITLPNGTVLITNERAGVSDRKSWFEPFVGARLGMAFDDRWLLSLRGDIGGFGVDGSRFAWQALGAVGYRWRHEGWDLNLFAGYRALGQDYSKDNFEWDVITHGPIVGLRFGIDF